ncbi:MAG: PRD domain-containing protein [Lachnospiraceae bacterium]|nr:PRD domain-containing protein [Lachnospiraceae bacterium]
MYRVAKVLNHNAIFVFDSKDQSEYLLLGRGIGFGKKVSEYVEARPEDTIYSLKTISDRGDAKEIAKSVSPECLDIANDVLNEAEKTFGGIDRRILFPMADHIEYAVRRIRNHEQISNPLTDDIRVLFHREYKVAQSIEPLLKKRMDVQIDEHEIGYIALHVHSAIENEKVSQAMQMAYTVRECIAHVERETGETIDIMSLAYNRLMNHVRHMVARALNGESLKLDMNAYMKSTYPQAFESARKICDELGRSLHRRLEDIEIGYLAMHIERVASDELKTPEEATTSKEEDHKETNNNKRKGKNDEEI